ncbi:MAG TPA: UbiD family decarboxylase [Chloroflexota bacterium]|nr:UbiD family decarboxylase [Chloroflexota bacterium]
MAVVSRELAQQYSPQPGELSLRTFLEELERDHPEWVVHVTEPVDPAKFEVTAVLQQLELRNQYPLVVFDRPLNLLGEVSELPIATNVYASRQRCAVALGLRPEDFGQKLALEYARREERRLPPVVVAKSEAPAKEIVQLGQHADLRHLPIIRHHRMDGGPYVDMSPVVRDPDTGVYNGAFLRMQYKGPRKLGLHMSPRHSWQIVRKHEERDEPTPIVVVVGHHPAYYLGALNVSPYGEDDYQVIGSIMDRPLRLTASETWGSDFMVPADADLLIEGEVLPNVREVEGPFGEFPGTYGPQRVRWVVDVKAITRRRQAVYQDIFTGHKDVWTMGSFPKEGAIFNRIKGVVPTVKAVHLPASGVGRFHCYISIDKKVDGESKQAALIALGAVDFVKHVIVVDADVDVYREEEVLWAMATRVQADQDVDIIKNVKGNTLDPSQTDDILTSKMIVDATKPVRRPFEARLDIAQDVLERTVLEDLIPPEQLARIRS